MSKTFRGNIIALGLIPAILWVLCWNMTYIPSNMPSANVFFTTILVHPTGFWDSRGEELWNSPLEMVLTCWEKSLYSVQNQPPSERCQPFPCFRPAEHHKELNLTLPEDLPLFQRIYNKPTNTLQKKATSGQWKINMWATFQRYKHIFFFEHLLTTIWIHIKKIVINLRLPTSPKLVHNEADVGQNNLLCFVYLLHSPSTYIAVCKHILSTMFKIKMVYYVIAYNIHGQQHTWQRVIIPAAFAVSN